MWIGIALGDVTGIGLEVALKAVAAEAAADDARYVLLGDAVRTRELSRQLGLNLPLQEYGGSDATGRIFLCDPLDEPLPVDLPPGAPVASRAAVVSLRDGAERCLRGELDAL